MRLGSSRGACPLERWYSSREMDGTNTDVFSMISYEGRVSDAAHFITSSY